MAGQSLKDLTKFKVTFAPYNFLSMVLGIVFEILEKRRSNLENDRGMALIVTSMVEELLERAIITKMRPLSKRDHDALFTGDTPLSTFSAKIKLGYALNLYGPVFRADLNRLREIRNVFAHAKLVVSLETHEIRAERWSRLSEQNLRFDKWSVCLG